MTTPFPPSATPIPPVIGPFTLGAVPRVVGTVTEASTLRRLAEGEPVPCDIVEVRLDQVGADLSDWQDLCRRVGEHGAPVLLTLRHVTEGGAWDGPEPDRLALLRDASSVVQAVDTEIGQGGIKAVREAFSRGEGAVIGSFHDFERTPGAAELEDVVREGIESGADLLKLACYIHGPGDEERLLALLEQHESLYFSILGMGPLGTATRVRFPSQGSCLTYGYLDRPAAPGQVHAGDLRDRLAAVCRCYAAALRAG